ncbi:MAG: hypothetical protein ACPGVT_02800 [Maricaulaceae bacterium]
MTIKQDVNKDIIVGGIYTYFVFSETLWRVFQITGVNSASGETKCEIATFQENFASKPDKNDVATLTLQTPKSDPTLAFCTPNDPPAYSPYHVVTYPAQRMPKSQTLIDVQTPRERPEEFQKSYGMPLGTTRLFEADFQYNWEVLKVISGESITFDAGKTRNLHCDDYDCDKGFTAKCADAGKSLHLRLNCKAALNTQAIKGLEDLRKLSVFCHGTIDLENLAVSFPNLVRLEIISPNKPLITNGSALRRFGAMQNLFIRSFYGFSADDVPPPGDMPDLDCLSLFDTDKDFAEKFTAREDLAYSAVIRLRDKAWLAINVNNPLSDWDSRDAFDPREYKRALAASKKVIRAARALGTKPKAKPDKALNEIKAFIDVLNGLEKSELSTDEREEVYAFLSHEIEHSGGKISQDVLDALFDKYREF